MAISPQRLTIYLYSAHRAVIFAIAQLSCIYFLCLTSKSLWNLLVKLTFYRKPKDFQDAIKSLLETRESNFFFSSRSLNTPLPVSHITYTVLAGT